jgi:putative hydrolase of the HAD superfamily
MAVAVVFDLDDTLYPEVDFVRSGFRSVAEWCRKEMGVDGFAETAWRLFSQGRRGDIFDAALSALGRAPAKDVITQLVTLYRTHAAQITLLPDSVRCLQQLRGRYKLGLITDGPAEMQWNKIRCLGLADSFDEIIVTSDLGDGFAKPHPRAFMEMEKRFQAAGSDLFYVADNPAKDFTVPARLGWRTIRILREQGLHRKAAGAAVAQFSVFDLSAIPRILAEC